MQGILHDIDGVTDELPEKWVKAVLRYQGKIFVKLRWKPKAVSMVLFSKGKMAFYDEYRDVINLKDG